MKTIFSILIFLIFIPQQDSNRIFWNEDRKLRWEDFQSTPPKGLPFAAITNTGISFSYSFTNENGKINTEYQVQSFFEPSGSWYIPEKVSSYILRHEQAHFDITELHARMLRKQLERKKFSKNVKSEMEAIYREVEQQKTVMQKKFDKETDHSRNEKNEIRWQEFIAKELANYNDWK